MSLPPPFSIDALSKEMTHSPHNQLIDKSDLVIHCYETILFYPFWSWKFLSINPLVILVPWSNAPTKSSCSKIWNNQNYLPSAHTQVTFLFLHKRRYYGVWKKSFIFGKKKVQMQYFFRSFKKEKCNYTQEKNKTHKKKDWHKNKPKNLFREITSINYSLTRNHLYQEF